MNNILNPITLTKKLISFPTITPVDAGIIDYLIEILSAMGFKCEKMIFDDVTNLYARYGNNSPNFCFAGHTDVVPIGDIASWKFPPFAGEIDDGKLYGRGAVDMKGALACFIAALSEFISDNKHFNGSISLLITGDEESVAINGTIKMLEYLKNINEKIDVALVGEPTCVDRIGDMVKIGRRGSLCAQISVNGMQGHVAYPHLADNPITKLVTILSELKQIKLDDGNESFQPSNLEITNLEVGNNASNVIPQTAKASFNIRFNNIHNAVSLKKLIEDICDKVTSDYSLVIKSTADCFITSDSGVASILREVIKDNLSIDTKFSTDGGTSDARFIKNYCPVVEFGLTNATAHKIDEFVAVDDLNNLKLIYFKLLEKYFSRSC